METPQPKMENEHTNFSLPVDSEGKATMFRLISAAPPHMRAFHLSWISFFSCFVSTFAASPLVPIIRDNLNLTATDIGNAGIASVSGAIFARLAMGTACDLFGPRLASASLILLTSPAVYFTASISSPNSFLLVRFFTGFSLSTFVSTSLGLISGMTGAGGNVGAVLTQLIFFKGSRYSKEDGITLMGIMIVCCTLPVLLIYFPQWGGMFCGPSNKGNATEEGYYLSEWDTKEKEMDLHQSSLKFANNSKGEKGRDGDLLSKTLDTTSPTRV